MAAIKSPQANQNVIAFLDMIAQSEGTSTSPVTKNDGYDVIVTGIHGPSVFTDYSHHPDILVEVRSDPPLYSTAAGRYQLLARYWVTYCKQLGLKDFSPLSQDLIAIQQIKERNAIESIIAGEITIAIERCSNIWASLPGNDYGQGGHSIETLIAWFNKFKGTNDEH